MEVTFDIDTNIWPYETIKLILQPFIENVLKHAWSGDRIHIRVSVQKEGDDILYRIIDDGLGMKQERIQEILDPQDHSHTGAGFETLTSGCALWERIRRVHLQQSRNRDFGSNTHTCKIQKFKPR